MGDIMVTSREKRLATQTRASPEQLFGFEVDAVLKNIGDLLKEKNRKYGDSALNPVRIFSKSDAVEQIKVRLDDKLKRMANQQSDEDEDVVTDLMGYLVLLRIAQRRAAL
jgi:hypothetical protein